MRAIINSLVDELNRLRASGVKTVSVSNESIAALRKAISKTSPTQEKKTSSSKNEFSALLETRPEEAPVAGKPSTQTPTLASSVSKPSAAPKPAPVKRLPSPPSFTVPEGDKASRMAWLNDFLQSDATSRAQLHEGKKLVLGVGTLDSDIMFIGEAPGAEEETQGEPFVGPAGQLLTKMIAAMGLKREQVYIGNILKWRPQLPSRASGIQVGNREPTEEEMQYCLPFLRAQIGIIQPKVLVGLGATAAKGMLGYNSFRTLGDVRSRWHEYLGRPLMITYHPSYLLRKESESKLSERKAKRAAWEDFLLVMEKIQLPISDKQRTYFTQT